MFSIFTLAIKFDCAFLTIFQSFYLSVIFIFNKFSKDVLNHYLLHSSAFNGLKSAKNVVFFSFCILVDMPMGGGYSPPPPPAPLAMLMTPSGFFNFLRGISGL